MERINLNENPEFMKKIETADSRFEVTPLDIRLAEVQMKLGSRAEKEIAQNNSFEKISESFSLISPAYNYSEIKIACFYDGIFNLELSVNNSNHKYSFIIKRGQKADIINMINDKKFFNICKSAIITISNFKQ